MKLSSKMSAWLRDLRLNAELLLGRARDEWSTWPENSRRFVTSLALLFVILLFLCLLGGCAASQPVAPPTRPCHVPTQDLQPTHEPAMKDGKAGELVEEAGKLREALRSCNADKARLHLYIQRRLK